MNPNQESEAEDDLPQQNVPNLPLQALMGHMERLLTRALEPIQEKLDEVDARTRNRQPLNVQNRCRGGRDISDEELEVLEEPPINRGRFRHGNGNREARNRESKLVLFGTLWPATMRERHLMLVAWMSHPPSLAPLSSQGLHNSSPMTGHNKETTPYGLALVNNLPSLASLASQGLHTSP
ncbi:hypothetical protein TIFTF001_044620 [Ficus carica]|uniref:Uncharacterized protein n=1 Tax=Ficus carica TaxID=3494 RepID=A0AA88CVT9_FICCA|nr:hypothetical protein TIFTF001_044614 [Ficus carica]GMN31735.1 hypothetical protein TIFTF001_044616 [Ficus carica]GMN31751.1 hypothetical protein TIFTF001_044618 [Ficus carica]GMN31767.1 hypothetical protein TIFTF001_044620 [Ficus carica]